MGSPIVTNHIMRFICTTFRFVVLGFECFAGGLKAGTGNEEMRNEEMELTVTSISESEPEEESN